VNANSDSSGVKGKQGNKGKKATSKPSELDWGEGGSESTNHCDESIVENSVATQDIEA
jgi:hypothetical protein